MTDKMKNKFQKRAKASGLFVVRNLICMFFLEWVFRICGIDNII